MIRGFTEKGEHFIGLTPVQMDRILAGERVCLPEHVDANGMAYPHICLFFRKDNAGLIEATHQLMPNGFLPGAAVEHVSKEEP